MKYDIVIIGNGPAGCSAALYAHRSGADVCVVSLRNSALLKTDKIENYYGISSVSGEELYQKGINQCLSLGINMLDGQVTSVSQNIDKSFDLETTCGKITCKSLIIACGANRKTVSIEGLKSFEGRGVSYCAVCDGFFFKNRTVGVIGSGDFAVSEARYLKGITDRVTIYTNGESLLNKPSDIAVNTLKIKELFGENKIEKIVFSDDSFIPVDGIFVAVGVASGDDFGRNLGLQTQNGKFIVDEKMQTVIPGIFAIGDCKSGIDQVASAVYEGMIAGMSASEFLKNK